MTTPTQDALMALADAVAQAFAALCEAPLYARDLMQAEYEAARAALASAIVAALQEAYERGQTDVLESAREQFENAELVDWLQGECGSNLISDDAGRWAVSSMGMQPVPPDGGFTDTVCISSIVTADEWRPTIREAIDAARSADQKTAGV
jgi:hypothetical protein